MLKILALPLPLLLLLAAEPALAQSAGEMMRLNAGYGRTPGQENRPIDPSTRDANGNRVIVNGLIQTGPDQSLYGDASTLSGAAGGVNASAVGNQLVVLTQGSWNTVVVDSTQINNGDVSASAELNGKVTLDAPH